MAEETPEQRIYRELRNPFPLEDLEWRMQSTGKGKNAPGDKVLMLAYVQARAVFDRLTTVLGVGNWSSEHRQVLGSKITTRKFKSSHSEGWGANRKEIPEDVEVREQECGWICKLTIRIGDKYIHHEDSSPETDIEALKGGFSKSLVRCAVRVGIGAYLYDMPKQWATLEGKGDRGFVPRNWKPDINLIPPECRPARGGGRPALAISKANVVDEEPPEDRKPEPVTDPGSVGEAIERVMEPIHQQKRLEQGPAFEAYRKIEKLLELFPLTGLNLAAMIPAQDKTKAEPWVMFAEAACRSDAERAKSGHWSKMRWTLDEWPKKKGDQVKSSAFYKGMAKIDAWAKEVRDSLHGTLAEEDVTPDHITEEE